MLLSNSMAGYMVLFRLYTGLALKVKHYLNPYLLSQWDNICSRTIRNTYCKENAGLECFVVLFKFFCSYPYCFVYNEMLLHLVFYCIKILFELFVHFFLLYFYVATVAAKYPIGPHEINKPPQMQGLEQPIREQTRQLRQSSVI